MKRSRGSKTTVAFLLLGALTMAAWHIDRFGIDETARPSGAIVVLGARVQADGLPSPTLRARAAHGAELFRRGLAPLVVFSGGVGVNPPSEASVAAKVAQALGVPAEHCVLDEESHSTRQNARLTAKLLRTRGINEVIVVSDPYHLRRARWLFEREGLTVTTSPALDAERHRSWTLRATWSVREVGSFIKDMALSFLEGPG